MSTVQTMRLPATMRAAALARRALGDRGTRLVYGSPLVHTLRRTLRSSAPAGYTLVRVCGGELRGAVMHIDLACEKYYWLGTHEEAVQQALAAHVRPGMTVYDAGAHAGFFTLLLSRLTGSAGHVIAFEPLPANVARLRDNVAANRCDNVDVRDVALSDMRGEAPFDVHASSLEGSLFDATGTGNVTVRVETLDDIVSAGAPPPDLIKVDVEGAEGRVLRGAQRTLARYRPALLLEVHSVDAAREVMEALPAGYVIRRLSPAGAVSRIETTGHYFARSAR